MIPQPFKKLRTAAKDIRLSDHERAAMRATLHAYMQAGAFVSAKPRLTKSSYTFIYLHRAAAFVLVPLVIILSVGGTAYAAEGSLPGDMLYPVKIGVNEQVQSALAFSPTAKAQVHVALASRRMAEAQTLAVRGRLDATTTAELQTNLEEHASQAQAISQTVAEADPDTAAEIAAYLSSSLSANNAVLEDLGAHSKDENTRKDIKILAAAVQVRVDSTELGSNQSDVGDATTSPQVMLALAPGKSAKLAKTSGTTSVATSAAASSSKPAPDVSSVARIGRRASTGLAHTTSFFHDIQSSLASDSGAQIELQLATLQQMLGQGNVALQSGDTASASQDFTKVYAASVRLETLLEAAQRLGGNLLDPLLKVQVSLGQVVGTTTATTSGQIEKLATTTASTTEVLGSTTPATTVHEAEEKKKNGSDESQPQSIFKKIFHAVME